VADKGGVKAVSADPTYGVAIAHSSPWYKELVQNGKDNNYHYDGKTLIWTIPSENICNTNLDFDITDNCKIKFEDPNLTFYKAKVFHSPTFSDTANKKKRLKRKI